MYFIINCCLYSALVEIILILFIKETEKNQNSVQKISTIDKTVHSDPSEKLRKILSPGNLISKYHLYIPTYLCKMLK